MDSKNISIRSLVKNKNTNIGSISVNSLRTKTKNNTKNNTKNVHIREIIGIQKLHEEEKIRVYKSYYNKCMEQIKSLCLINKNEMTFAVPYTCNLNVNYNMQECLTYIMHKLEKDNFYIVSKNNIIFITWKYISLTSQC